MDVGQTGYWRGAFESSARWSTPICHSAGGGDSVLVVEDGWLVSRAISRWKRDASSMKLFAKKLMKVRGQVPFLVSPDSFRAVVLQEDVSTGLHSLTVIDGESTKNGDNNTKCHIINLP